MTFLIYLIAFFIIRGGYRSTGNGSFTASLLLFVGIMCAYSGMWFYAIVIGGLSFVVAGGMPRRRHPEPYPGQYPGPYDRY